MIADGRLDWAAERAREARELVDEVEGELSASRHPHATVSLLRAQKLLSAALRAINDARNGDA